MASDPLLILEAVSKDYRQGGDLVPVLDDVHLRMPRGRSMAVVGPSGAGKSTLLHLMGGLDRPTSGRVLFEGRDLGQLSGNELAQMRRRRIGFVFQFFNLVPTLSAWHNIALPLLFDGVPPARARDRARELAGRLEIEDKLDAPAALLSGGEMQRTAIGRAIAAEPTLVLADEPTGSLDSRTGGQVLDLLIRMVTDAAASLVLVTHDAGVADLAESKVRIVDGRVDAA